MIVIYKGLTWKTHRFCIFWEVSSAKYGRVGVYKIVNAVWDLVYTSVKILDSSQYTFKWGKVLHVQYNACSSSYDGHGGFD